MLNDLGELLDPAVVILLIGERPGLATAASLSAYMAYRPRPDTTTRAGISSPTFTTAACPPIEPPSGSLCWPSR